MLQDVGGHQYRVTQQTDVDVVGVLADLVFERSGAFQLADIGVHTQQQRQFGYFGNVALHVDRGSLRIEPCGKVFRQHVLDVDVQHVGIRMRRQRMVVGDEEKAPFRVLHFDKVPERPEIVSEVQVSGRPYSTDNSFHN